MAVTPEQARTELMRRKSLQASEPVKTSSFSPKITPEQARAELMRRKSLQVAEIDKSEQEGFSEYGRSLARGTKNAIVGAIDSLDFLATPVRAAINLGAKALGSEYQVPALGEEVAKTVDTMTGGYTKPRTESEKTTDAIARGVGSLPSGLALGIAAKGAQYTPKVVKGIGEFLRGSNALTPTNLAATAATSGLTQQALNENPDDIEGAIGAGLLGGLGVPATAGILSGLTKGGRQRGAAWIGEQLNIHPQYVETFQKSGITPTLADVSKGKIAKLLTSKFEYTPTTGESIRKAKEIQRSQIAEGLGQGDFGRNLSKAEASNLVTKGAKEYQKGKSKEFSKIFARLDGDISNLPDDKVGIENTTKYFDTFLKNIKTPSQERRFLKSPIGKMYTDLYETAKQNNGKLPYHDAKERLDEINDLITTQGQIGKISQGKLKQFASRLSQDIESSLEPQFKKLGGDSYKNWKEAKKYYAQYAQEDIPKLNEIYKKDKKGATDAFIDLMSNQKKGGEKAKIALQGLSHGDQIDLMDAVNKNLGAKSDGSFSPLVWNRKFKALDPESQKILLSPLNKESQKRVFHIADAIDHLKSTLEEANTSKTAYHTALGALSAAAGGGAIALMNGNPIPIATLGTTLFLSKMTSEKLLTNPKFINWIYKSMKAKDLAHFQRNLERIPKVGSLQKTFLRQVQSFQHDLNQAKEKKESKK